MEINKMNKFLLDIDRHTTTGDMYAYFWTIDKRTGLKENCKKIGGPKFWSREGENPTLNFDPLFTFEGDVAALLEFMELL